MKNNLKLICQFSIFGFLGLVSGCATQELREVRAQCTAEGLIEIPPKIEQQIVNKMKEIKVPTGNVNCTTVGDGKFATTSCIAQSKTENIPYTAVENIDIKKFERDKVIKQCTYRICFKRFGNLDCKM